ncbi:uncharacterized protein [Apostichopus japonicus]|uniref:uncharacterized protein n=1 Tax=Stichopus japonicus TaxID=307972 RepID=UPI003AB5E1E0
MKPFTIIAAMVCGIYLLLEWTEGGKVCYYTTTIDETGATKWTRDKGDCDVIKFGGVKTTATPKSFTGIPRTTQDILTSSTAQKSGDKPSIEAVGSTNNPSRTGESSETTLIPPTIFTEFLSTQAVNMSTQTPAGKTVQESEDPTIVVTAEPQGTTLGKPRGISSAQLTLCVNRRNHINDALFNCS